MFEYLSGFRVILVTGPQRSGTRIASKMIAHDTGYTFIDERRFDCINVGKWSTLVLSLKNVVIQCPSMCRYVGRFGSRDDVAVVLTVRAVADIIKSQQRIGWTWEPFELARYGRTDGEIAKVKYAYWAHQQRHAIKHAYEIDYTDLAEHPLWVDAPLRESFNAFQTEVNQCAS